MAFSMNSTQLKVRSGYRIRALVEFAVMEREIMSTSEGVLADTPDLVLSTAKRSELKVGLLEQLSEHGYCHIRCQSREEVEALLLDAQVFLGQIMRHERSLANGLVPVRFKPEISEGERLISDTSGEAEAHMDGVFMPSPPGVIALGVVELSGDAPETYTIDFRSILSQLTDEVLLRHSREDAAHITRTKRTTSFTPLEFCEGRVRVRFRFDHDVELKATDGGPPLFEHMYDSIQSTAPSVHGLTEGSVIFIDNTRVLHGRTPFDPYKTKRLLLRAWYPATQIRLGVPWNGRRVHSHQPTVQNFLLRNRYHVKIESNAIFIETRDPLPNETDALIYAVRQAIGFRHSPIAWDVTRSGVTSKLCPQQAKGFDEAPLGTGLKHDLEALLPGCD